MRGKRARMTSPERRDVGAVEALVDALADVPILMGWTTWQRRVLARAVLDAGYSLAADRKPGLREAERVVRLVFENAREHADEIEGGKVPLPDGGVVWLHTADAIDTWLQERLAYELAHGAAAHPSPPQSGTEGTT